MIKTLQQCIHFNFGCCCFVQFLKKVHQDLQFQSTHFYFYFLKFCKDYFLLWTKIHLATMNVIRYNLMFNAVVWLFVSLRHLKHFFRCREFMKSHVLFNLHLLRCYDNQCSNSQNDGILKKIELEKLSISSNNIKNWNSHLNYVILRQFVNGTLSAQCILLSITFL